MTLTRYSHHQDHPGYGDCKLTTCKDFHDSLPHPLENKWAVFRCLLGAAPCCRGTANGDYADAWYQQAVTGIKCHWRTGFLFLWDFPGTSVPCFTDSIGREWTVQNGQHFLEFDSSEQTPTKHYYATTWESGIFSAGVLDYFDAPPPIDQMSVGTQFSYLRTEYEGFWNSENPVDLPPPCATGISYEGIAP